MNELMYLEPLDKHIFEMNGFLKIVPKFCRPNCLSKRKLLIFLLQPSIKPKSLRESISK